mgnify:CR=1 FL=1
MAYVKQNWECGQVITADKLNHMEDGIENAGGDCDAGYACYHGGDTIFSETVTLEESTQQGVYEAVLQYDKIILDTTIRVSINGGEFGLVGGEEGFYGDEEFTDHILKFIKKGKEFGCEKEVAEFYQQIEALHQSGTAIIMVSHDIQTAATYATHVLHIGREQLFFGKTQEYQKSEAWKILNITGGSEA